MNALITAGPTREYLDAVRYLSNASSGRMGMALARACLRRGWNTTVIAGPVEAAPPRGARVVPVTSAKEMLAAVARLLPRADILFMCAAVADYRPARRLPGKMKKTGDPITLRLVPTKDILSTLAPRRRPGQVIVGFALESRDLARHALRKLRDKRLDLVVANGPETIGSPTITAHVLSPRGVEALLYAVSKNALAACVVSLAAAAAAAKRARPAPPRP
ncbi:MAG: phosphopantothenoylcysteine decarboxylase [Planctomycetes bacterium]|nr:phosphopantothenoylcysteine decarboxylase [Planctomycetota bacterium]